MIAQAAVTWISRFGKRCANGGAHSAAGSLEDLGFHAFWCISRSCAKRLGAKRAGYRALDLPWLRAQQCFGSYRVFGADSAQLQHAYSVAYKVQVLHRLPVAAHRSGLPCPWLWLGPGLSSYRHCLRLHSPWTCNRAAIPCKRGECRRSMRTAQGLALYPVKLRT